MKHATRNSSSLVLCIAEIIIGILLLINPVGFTSGIIVVLGIVLAVWGISCLISYFNDLPEYAAKQNQMSKGLFLVCIGAFCIFKSSWFIATFPLLTAIYGILTLVTGFSKIQRAVDMLRLKLKYWFVALIGALLTVVFSVLILVNPFTSTAVLWTFIGITLLIEAIADLIALILRKK